jgi:hypothetical protein
MRGIFKKILLSVMLAAIVLPAFSANAGLLVRTTRPAWVYSDAAYDIDFANNRAWNGNTWNGTGTSSRASAAVMIYNGSGAAVGSLFTQWKDGILRKNTELYQNRVSDYGLWVEGGPDGAINYALCARDLTNATCATAWTLTNISATKTSVVGADNTTGNATKLTATGANGTALQTITSNGKTYANSTGITSTVATGGTAYTNGNTVTMVGGTCTTAPAWTVTASGGVVSAVTQSVVGSCTVLPSSPVAVTGGSGAGLTINPAWVKGTASAWIKCVTCTGAISLTADNSTFTDISGSLSTSKFTQVRVPTVNKVNNTVGINIANSSDVIIVDFFQFEGDDQATSPISTTTTTNQRGFEMPAFGSPASSPNAGLPVIQSLYWGTPVTFLVQYSGNFSTQKGHLLSIGTDSAEYFVTGAAGGGTASVAGHGGSYTSTGCVDTTGLFTLNKIAVRYDGSGSAVAINGCLVKSSSITFTPTAQLATHAGQLNNGSNNVPTNGYESRWTAWKRSLSDGEMVQLTTVTNNQ